MWYPATITVAATAEPVTVDEVKAQAEVEHADRDALIAQKISEARDYVQKYCGTRLSTQTIAVKCDRFADMVRLPEGPVQSVASISYLDVAGDVQTLPDTVYELRADDLDAAVVLKSGQSWPAIQPGSRITLTAVVGYADLPPVVKGAMLLHVATAFAARENAAAERWTAVDCLLCNDRRGV